MKHTKLSQYTIIPSGCPPRWRYTKGVIRAPNSTQLNSTQLPVELSWALWSLLKLQQCNVVNWSMLANCRNAHFGTTIFGFPHFNITFVYLQNGSVVSRPVHWRHCIPYPSVSLRTPDLFAVLFDRLLRQLNVYRWPIRKSRFATRARSFSLHVAR